MYKIIYVPPPIGECTYCVVVLSCGDYKIPVIIKTLKKFMVKRNACVHVLA